MDEDGSEKEDGEWVGRRCSRIDRERRKKDIIYIDTN